MTNEELSTRLYETEAGFFRSRLQKSWTTPTSM